MCDLLHSYDVFVFTVMSYHRCEIWCPSGSDDHCPDDQLCFAFSKCHAVDQNGMTMEQMEKQKNEYQNFNNNNNNNTMNGGSQAPAETMAMAETMVMVAVKEYTRRGQRPRNRHQDIKT